jgi:hypothetical protein
MKDRMRDGADVFTATVGVGAGAKVRVGPVQAGLITMGDSIGLRGGRFYSYDRYVFGGDMCLVIAGIEDFNCMGRAVGPRRKEFTTTYCVVPIPMDFKGGPSVNASYWTQIEAVMGIGGTLRLGFNPGELLDFILGWTTIDIYGDDLEAKKQKEKSNQSSEATPKPGAPQ